MNRPQTLVMVLDQGRIAFMGSVSEFEDSSLDVVSRLTHAFDTTDAPHFTTIDPWDKRRRPRERVL